jgi:hypothetical protein
MKPSRHAYACLVFLATFSINGWTKNLCPLEVDTQQAVSTIPPGYEVAEDTLGHHRLTFVEVYDGPVKEMASLVPDEQKSNESRWVFGDWSTQRGIEVACHYSRTRLVLVKKLPKETKLCVARYRAKTDGLREGSAQIASFECQ